MNEINNDKKMEYINRIEHDLNFNLSNLKRSVNRKFKFKLTSNYTKLSKQELIVDILEYQTLVNVEISAFCDSLKYNLDKLKKLSTKKNKNMEAQDGTL